MNAGYGTIINRPDGTEIKIYDACWSFNSSFFAKKEAITHAVKYISNMFDINVEPTSVVIFTDSLSTLKALDSGAGGDNLIQEMD